MFQCPEDDVISRSYLPGVAVTSESWRWWPGQRWVALRRAGLRAKRYWSRWSPSWRQRPSQLPRWHQHTQPAQGGILSLGSTKTRVYSGTFYIPSHAKWWQYPPCQSRVTIPSPAKKDWWQYPPLPEQDSHNQLFAETLLLELTSPTPSGSWPAQRSARPGQLLSIPSISESKCLQM